MAAKKKTAKTKTAKTKAAKKFRAPRQLFLTLSGDMDISGTYPTFKQAKSERYDNGIDAPEQVVGPYILAERKRQE